MENLQKLFGDDALTYSELQERLKSSQETILLANLRSGKYVSKDKFSKLDAKYKKLAENSSENVQVSYDNLQKEYTALQAEFDNLKNQNTENAKMQLISSMNVNPKFSKFVKTEVEALTNDKVDFQSALKDYLKSNKEFLNNANRGNHINLEQGKTARTSVQKMNDFIRGVKK